MVGGALVVMEGGHPWGFRIEGGAEVRQPIKINRVLGDGKAYHHGIQAGDVLSSINGEDTRSMTISRARHLIRASDNLLVLEVMRSDRLLIPEIRVISPTENLVNGGSFQYGPISKDSQRMKDNQLAETIGSRPYLPERSSRTLVPATKRPVPPPKPPLAVRNAAKLADSQKAMMFTSPVSPSSAMVSRSRNPAVLTIPASASSADAGSAPHQSQQLRQAAWQNARNPSGTVQHPSNSHDRWTFSLSGPNFGPRGGPRISSPRPNTESAPVKPIGIGRLQPGGKMEVPGSQQRLWSRNTEPVDGMQFRRRTTDAGTTDKNLSSTGVVLPMSSTSKPPTLPDTEFGLEVLHISENPYDLLPSQQEKVFNVRGQTRGGLVSYRNSYNDKKLGVPLVATSQLQRNWPKKIEDFEAGYNSSTSQSEIPDYEYLPPKASRHQNLELVRRDQPVLGDRTIRRDLTMARDRVLCPVQPYAGITARQKMDEDNLRRKLEIERVIAEEKRRRQLKDQIANMERRHNDYFTPLQRRSLLMDRFSDDELAEALVRPTRRAKTRIRGKARALHTFRAQNSRELSFKKNDVIYLMRQIDKNWFEGERHGIVGIFPVTYVEVITSLDEAKATAILREGTATAVYNFKAQTDFELPLKKGDLVTLVRRVDENWYEGRIGSRQGIFPVTYVETHREPDTPMATPMPSLAPTPVPGTPTCPSPVSSIFSVGPEIPSAPMSPLDLDFYESDWDAESFGALQTGRPLRTSRPTSPSASHASSQVSDREITPVPSVTSPVPTGSVARCFSPDASRAQDPSRKVFPSPVASKEADKVARQQAESSVEQGQAKGTSGLGDNTTSGKPDAAKQRPPSGRAASLGGQRTGKQKTGCPVKPLPVEGRDRRDGFSKSPGMPNPYVRYRAVYNYKPQNLDELELLRGDVIFVMEKCSDGWFVGISDRTKQFGTFPGNFVRPV